MWTGRSSGRPFCIVSWHLFPWHDTTVISAVIFMKPGTDIRHASELPEKVFEVRGQRSRSHRLTSWVKNISLDVFVLSGGISDKLATNIHNVRGNCWKGQRSKTKVIGRPNTLLRLSNTHRIGPAIAIRCLCDGDITIYVGHRGWLILCVCYLDQMMKSAAFYACLGSISQGLLTDTSCRRIIGYCWIWAHCHF